MNKNKTKKEIIDTVKFIGLLVIVLVFFKLIFTFIPPLNEYNIFAIKTDSMDPVIAPGEVVITREIDPEDIQVGDIIAFNIDITNDGIDDVVVHYIAEINSFNNELIFKTKPNVSDLHDSWTIEEKDIIGIHEYQINNIGGPIMFAQSWIGIMVILIDIIVVSFVYDALFVKKEDKKKEKKESYYYR